MQSHLRVQTKKDIHELMESRGLRPRKRFGQNFLIDGNLMRRLAESSQAGPGDVVLEVGGGTGGLTELLLERGAEVICVEIDRDLAELLRARFTGQGRFELIEGDALENKNSLNPAVLAALQKGRPGSEAADPCHPSAAADPCHPQIGGDGFESPVATGRAMLVANLPYQIATPLVTNLLLEAPCIRRLCFTVQAEVGDRILAAPGTRDYGPVSVLMQLCCSLSMIARVPAAAFWPAPQVESVMLRADVREPAVQVGMVLKEFSRFVRGAFEHRRKTLKSALKYVVGEEEVKRLAEGFDLSRRAEDLRVEEWVQLFASR
ncbi:MAG: 16S rRNA (adenine(1518)-N(6)/adenine(1519)-N(6))-dimethyltransferase [Phycisphaerales bacterium]|nr:16S rRNA (adenine(1518)-N(6)/adenine(1519)-N(6))-dimethyltransferase [Phycisphaerales bacterium]